jgi:hypothetical protein
MSVVRVVRGALLCALLMACGERAGDPVVLVASGQAGGGSGGSDHAGATSQPGFGGSGGHGGSGSLDPGNGPVGLCGPCRGSDECGDANDACIRYQDHHFCGRDCDEQRGCPDGYTCVQLDSSQLLQCVPQNGCAEPALAPPPLEDVRQYLLAHLNAERLAHDRPALAPSDCLDELAQDSAVDFARTDEPLGKYVKECDPIWPSCACGWNAEAELAIAHYGLDWTMAIDHAIAQAHDSQIDRFSQAFLSGEVTDVGLGFWISGDEAWIALSFR